MREIKFRIPHYSFENTFVGFTYWGRLEKDSFASPATMSDGPIKKPDEQFTGRKDKNGKDIYEGDQYKDSWGNISTVKLVHEDGRKTTGHGESERIIFSGFKINFAPEEIEIIGNIHDNKGAING